MIIIEQKESVSNNKEIVTPVTNNIEKMQEKENTEKKSDTEKELENLESEKESKEDAILTNMAADIGELNDPNDAENLTKKYIDEISESEFWEDADKDNAVEILEDKIEALNKEKELKDKEKLLAQDTLITQATPATEDIPKTPPTKSEKTEKYKPIFIEIKSKSTKPSTTPVKKEAALTEEQQLEQEAKRRNLNVEAIKKEAQILINEINDDGLLHIPERD